MVIYSVGHKSPDSDSVCAAIAIADLQRQIGRECHARVAGEVNKETRFVLEKFRMRVPDVLEDASGEEIILVDHTELDQAVFGMKDAHIKGIVDHHNLGDVSTSEPVDILVRPLGSTCTIIKGVYDFFKKEIPKDIAGIMLCAILSDTVIFRSPTTTDVDRWVAEELSELSGVDSVKDLGVEMFKVRSDIKGMSAKHLMSRNYKDYEMGDKKIGIGQLELAGLEDVLKRKDALLKEAQKLKDKGRFAVFIMLTDILKQGTELICISDDENLEKKVFGCGEDCWVDGMMSRKKQVVPRLEEYFDSLD